MASAKHPRRSRSVKMFDDAEIREDDTLSEISRRSDH